MKLAIHAAGKTDIGLVRKNNEDNFGYDLRHGIFVVCDGIGGQAAGEVASKIAVESMLGSFGEDPRRREARMPERVFEGASERANALARAIQLANQAIRRASTSESGRTGMGCTLVAVAVEGSLFSIAHVGDSRIYLIRGDAIHLLTSDHSLVMEQVRRGIVSLEEAEHSPMQHVIVRALGSEENVEPDLADLSFEDGDTLLLCSDGLSRYVVDSDILAVINRPQPLDEICEELIRAAKAGGSDDNITCLLIRAVGQSWGGRIFDRLTMGKNDGPQPPSD